MYHDTFEMYHMVYINVPCYIWNAPWYFTMYHDTFEMYHDTLPMYHGSLLMYHGTLRMYIFLWAVLDQNFWWKKLIFEVKFETEWLTVTELPRAWANLSLWLTLIRLSARAKMLPHWNLNTIIFLKKIELVSFSYGPLKYQLLRFLLRRTGVASFGDYRCILRNLLSSFDIYIYYSHQQKDEI